MNPNCYRIVRKCFRPGKRVSMEMRKVWNLLLLAGCWAIWGARNAKFFKAKVQTQDVILLRIIAAFRNWINCPDDWRSELCRGKLNSLIGDWPGNFFSLFRSRWPSKYLYLMEIEVPWKLWTNLVFDIFPVSLKLTLVKESFLCAYSVGEVRSWRWLFMSKRK